MNFEIEKKLENLRKDFLLTKVPRQLEEQGFYNILSQLKEKKQFSTRSLWFSSTALIALLFLVSIFGWKKVEASLPGDSLYSVKKLSEEFIIKATGNPQVKLENRAKEIIKAVDKSKKSKEKLKQATQNYQKEIEETDKKVKPEKRKEFNKNLKKHESEFKEIIQKSPSFEKDLEKAVEATKKVMEENESKKLEDIKKEKNEEKVEFKNEDNSGSNRD